MKAEMVVAHFVDMCYHGKRTNESSGNWRADYNKGWPELRLFGNRIAWLKLQWGDTDDIIETSNCGWNTRTTNKGLGWVRCYTERVKFNRRQFMMFEEDFYG